ncbi:hypothetical protein BDB00DRAFT_876585 [Zychaea mexicana]|uniref:uncharacterized protein n=1 Tax=Zychaea mexicana TaxID=64656 RepID=UPI0022FE7C5F|nr:uncharacterized protein BDB00DRAFT_876585 [Zychaea mexicana]KAI9489214.1 hypothetical protein BDB00DRAFT_876585 [Zychaea mexicana]
MLPIRGLRLHHPTSQQKEWVNVDENPFVAYIQGYGVQVPVPQSLEATDDVLLTCGCKEKKTTYITTVYKWGTKKSSSPCKKCPEHSLPLVMMRRHLFPSTSSDPQHAIRTEQTRSFHNMHFICRTSIHAIAELARAEYHFKLPIPASFKQRLTEALP